MPRNDEFHIRHFNDGRELEVTASNGDWFDLDIQSGCLVMNGGDESVQFSPEQSAEVILAIQTWIETLPVTKSSP